ncbi:hypothetical protein GLOIN_2v1568303 [Rhizophagus irregularis DAOM 181602=DAOM 197198]|nr:hypothetical protein GLOIN_2v1568303 [Rhizophagus irregularis DAOM 181602=DAOM 197198]
MPYMSFIKSKWGHKTMKERRNNTTNGRKFTNIRHFRQLVLSLLYKRSHDDSWFNFWTKRRQKLIYWECSVCIILQTINSWDHVLNLSSPIVDQYRYSRI